MITSSTSEENRVRIEALLVALRSGGDLPVGELKELRSACGMTQAEMADAISASGTKTTQDMVSRYENGNVAMPIELAKRYVRILGDRLGVNLDLLIAEPEMPFEGIDPGEPYKNYIARLSFLQDYLREQVPSDVPDLLANPPSNFELLVRRLKRKPVLAVLGRADAGKSHVSNSIIGRDVLPADYQPLTRVPIAVMHSDDRPAGIDQDVLVMKGPFDLELLSNETHLAEHVVRAGGHDVLWSSVTHGETEDDESRWAVVFCPAPVLKACTIIDTPGFSASDEDTDRAEEAVRSAELVIYCSPFITCFDAEDQLRIGRLLRALPCPETTEPSLPPLQNIVFAITHAGPQVNERQLAGIRAKTCRRFLNALREILASRTGDGKFALNEEDIKGMFVPFWSETSSRHREMRARAHSMLAVHFPKFRRCLADQEITRFRDQATDEVRQKVQYWEEFLLRWEEQKRLFQEAERNEPQRKATSEATKQQIVSKIRDYCHRSVGEFSEYFLGSCSVDALEHDIRSNFNSKDEAAQGIGPMIFRKLEGKTAGILSRFSKKLAKRINSFLKEYNEAGGRWGGVSGDCSGAAGATPAFDAAAAFAGGLAGLATFGALAFWASTLGNLGGYIIVAKAVGLLAAIGISTGSAATAIATVAAFGGPVVFAAALAVIAAIGAIMIFRKSWQRRMAEKIHEDLNKQNVCGKIEHNIREFWKHTETAFVKAAESTEAAYQKEFDVIKADLQSNSRYRIERQLGAFKKLASFFDKLPWFGFDDQGTGGNNGN